MNSELDLMFDDSRYVNLRILDFETLETINDGWYTIENNNNYSTLSIILYDNNIVGDIILFEEEISLLHPYYE